MKEKLVSKQRKWFLMILAAALLTLMAPGLSSRVYAGTASKNKKAAAAYERKMASIRKKSSFRSSKYADLTGDGVYEFLVAYAPKSGGPEVFSIFTYKSGKVKCMFSDRIYGLSKLITYKKSKAFIAYTAGHGGENYIYYKKSGSNFKQLGKRSRIAIAGGGMKNGPWYYYDKKGRSISKTAFNAAVKGVKKGSRKTLKLNKWKTEY